MAETVRMCDAVRWEHIGDDKTFALFPEAAVNRLKQGGVMSALLNQDIAQIRTVLAQPLPGSRPYESPVRPLQEDPETVVKIGSTPNPAALQMNVGLERGLALTHDRWNTPQYLGYVHSAELGLSALIMSRVEGEDLWHLPDSEFSKWMSPDQASREPIKQAGALALEAVGLPSSAAEWDLNPANVLVPVHPASVEDVLAGELTIIDQNAQRDYVSTMFAEGESLVDVD